MAKCGNPNAAEVGKLGGRPKGSKDKLSRDVKTRIMQIWDRLASEGKDLYDEADKDPKWFYTNFVKGMIPKDITVAGDQDNPLVAGIQVTFVKPEE